MLEPLEAYFRLLTQWNAKINLTALPLEPPTDETFDRLLIEPLAAASQIPADVPASGSTSAPAAVAGDSAEDCAAGAELTMVESKERKERVPSRGHSRRWAWRTRASRPSASRSCRKPAVPHVIWLRSGLFEPRCSSSRSAAVCSRMAGQLLMFRPAHSASPDPTGFLSHLDRSFDRVPQSFLSVYRVECSTWNND